MRKKPPMDSVRLPKKTAYGEKQWREMEPFKNASPKGRTPYSNKLGFALDEKGKLALRAAPSSTVARVLGAKKSPYKSNIPAADVSKIRTTPTKRAGEPEILDVVRKERAKMRKDARDAVDRKRAVEYYERKMTPKQHRSMMSGTAYRDLDAIDSTDDARTVAKELRKKDVTAARKAAMAPAKKAVKPAAQAASAAAPVARRAGAKVALGMAKRAGKALLGGKATALMMLADAASSLPEALRNDKRKLPAPKPTPAPPKASRSAATTPSPKPAPPPKRTK